MDKHSITAKIHEDNRFDFDDPSKNVVGQFFKGKSYESVSPYEIDAICLKTFEQEKLLKDGTYAVILSLKSKSND